MSFKLEVKRELILQQNVTVKYVESILAVYAQRVNGVLVELRDVDFHEC